MTTLENKQTAYLAGLRELLVFMSNRPALVPNYGGLSVYVWADNAEQLAALTLALGTGTKRASGGTMTVARKFGPHELIVIANRKDTCTQREVGQEVREMLVEADDVQPTDTVLPADQQPKQVKVRRMVPAYEWDCPPILAAVPDEMESANG